MDNGSLGLQMKKNVKDVTKLENFLMSVDAKKLLTVAKVVLNQIKDITFVFVLMLKNKNLTKKQK